MPDIKCVKAKIKRYKLENFDLLKKEDGLLRSLQGGKLSRNKKVDGPSQGYEK